MKNNLFFSMVPSLLFFLAHTGVADISCSTVTMKATGKATTPAAACCSGLQQLAQSVKSVEDKKAYAGASRAVLRTWVCRTGSSPKSPRLARLKLASLSPHHQL
ncbi:hypothetical protein Acr_00g0082440 [Actinidia rufa]|uniref:Uncharacterized protein n=1 Tax=Actinidia rufa TaxID=165716 RepID=A0A7J0DWE0_9ERIC|nr:hypothetical protein Acr_00g0082440 [Actinidia rufa]